MTHFAALDVVELRARCLVATPLLAKHIAGHERDSREEYPACWSCGTTMESFDIDSTPAAFCADCAYVALDVAAPAAIALPEALDEIERLRAGLAEALEMVGDCSDPESADAKDHLACLLPSAKETP